MSRLGQRVGSLEARPPPPARAPAAAFDPGRLTFAEQVELGDLLRPLALLPGEHWDLDPLSTAPLERAHALVAKGHGRGEGPG